MRFFSSNGEVSSPQQVWDNLIGPGFSLKEKSPRRKEKKKPKKNKDKKKKKVYMSRDKVTKMKNGSYNIKTEVREYNSS